VRAASPPTRLPRPTHLLQAQQHGVDVVAAVLQGGHLAQLHQLVDAGGGEVALVEAPPAGGQQ
jgi:hypothetical protein